MKRALDIAAALMALALLWPLLLALALAVRLDSPGPALFRQERVGLHGRPFRIHKFRTMRTGESGPLVTASGDARITRVGRVLRRHKLDELPQLLDVLRGRMSLVGPRPEVARYMALYPAEARSVILSVRPGLTDPASIAFRREEELLAASPEPERTYIDTLMPLKQRYYLDYVRTQSLRGDLAIVLRTAAALLGGGGA
ncbi:sugar transferase [Pulveribacter suum]|uniref:Sugar transferase n=1 Tax=Pulveribacter suum TaxID=2116657 RepID=A0A2P1NJP2_9BURK|nr:sugar transferase [Pulveribacter suum]AVP57265.1 sugar transferase [Pulveribacter suum]